MAGSASLTIRLFGKDVSAGQTFDKLGRKAGELGGKFRGFGTVAAGALAGIGLANVAGQMTTFAKDSVEAFSTVGGETMKLQRFLGGTAEDASRLGHALRMSGVDTDTATKSFGILSKNLASNSKAFAQAGISIRDAQGNLRPMSVLLPDIAERFKTMPAGPEKTALALKLFGKSGAALLPFLSRGKQGLADLAAESDKLGTTLSGKDLEAVKANTAAKRSFGEAVKGLQISLGRELYPVLTAVATFMRESVVPIIRAVIGWLKDHKDIVTKVAVALGILVVALGSTAKIIQVVTAVVRIWTAVQAAFNAVMAANPIVLVILAIVALVAILVVAYKKFDWFRAFVDKVWDGIQAVVEKVVGWFQQTAWPILKRVIDLIAGYYRWLWEKVRAVWDWIWEKVEAFLGWWQNTAWPIIKQVIDFIVGYYQTMWSVISNVFTWILDKIGAFASWFSGTFGPAIGAVVNLVKGYYGAVWTVVSNVFGWITEKIGGFVAFFRDTVAPVINTWAAAIGNYFRAIWTAASSAWSSITGAISTFYTWFRDTVAGAISSAANTISGAWNLVKSGASVAWNAVAGVISTAWAKMSGPINSLKSVVGNIFGGVAGAARAAWNGVASAWNSTVGSLSWDVPSWIPFIGGNTVRAPRIPTLAVGGIATAATLAVIGERGPEAIVPLSRARDFGFGGGGPVVVNVTVSGVLVGSKDELARVVGGALDEAIGRGTYRPRRIAVA